jgi:alkylation response protein AidB-like acyl-CoA dehydrogenase
MARIPEIKEEEKYRILRETARDYAAKELEPGAEQFDLDPAAPQLQEAIVKSEGLGMLSALVPEELGGGDLDAYAFCVALEELGAESAGVAAALLIHNAAQLPLALSEHREGISKIASVSTLACLAHPGELAVSGGKINGRVPFAFNAAESSFMVLFSSGGEPATVAMVSGETDGLEVKTDLHQMGLRPARAGSLQFNGVEPMATLPQGDKMQQATERFLYLGLAAIATGIAKKAFSKAYDYACDRYQAGDKIIKHQQMRVMLGEMLAGIEENRAMISKACASEDMAPAMVTWIKATQNGCKTAIDGVQIHGGYGYMRDYGMERLMRDAKYCQMYPITDQDALLKLLELSESD